MSVANKYVRVHSFRRSSTGTAAALFLGVEYILGRLVVVSYEVTVEAPAKERRHKTVDRYLY